MIHQPKTARVSALTEDLVTLEVDSVSLTWPRADFHEVHVGDTLHLVVFKHTDIEAERAEVARALLNHVLHPNE